MPVKSDLQQWRERQQAERILGFWFPVLLFFSGLQGWLFPSHATFAVTTGLGTLAGLLALCLILFRQRGVRLSWVLATGLLLGYAGGALNTDLGLMRVGTNVADHFGRLQGDLSAAASILLWVCALLFVVGGMFESPLVVRVKRLAPSDHRILWVGLCVVLLSFAAGDLTFDGAKLSPDTRPSALGALSALFVQILPGATILLLANSKWRRHVVPLLFLILAECGLMILIGRRVLIYGLVIACLASAMAGLRFNLSIWKKAALAVVAAVMVGFGMQFFFAMRVTNWRLADDDIPIRKLISSTFETLADKDGISSINDALAENMRDRTSIILYLSDLIAASEVYPPLHGQDAVYSFKRAIPSAFYPDKEEVLSSEETLANPRFGLVIEDDANSILTTGVSDFGVFGCFCYPLILIGCFRLLLWFLRTRCSEAAYVVAVVAILTELLQAESSTAGYIDIARNGSIVAIAITLAKKWPALRRKKTGYKNYFPLGSPAA